MTFMATCPKCKGKFGHPGPCPKCQPWYGPHIQAALDLAYEAHRNEYRNGGDELDGFREPYICHIFAIMKLAKRIGISGGAFDVYRAIILHDTVESGFPIERIRAVCTLTADYVLMMTHDPEVQSKADYMASFSHPDMPIVVVLTKLLDRICNVWDFYEDGNPYFVKYFHKADGLFTTMFARKAEIIHRWGTRAWNNLEHEYRRLHETVTGWPS